MIYRVVRTAVVLMALPMAASAQWGAALNTATSMMGGGSAATKPASEYVRLATVSFLEGGQLLLDATGETTKAQKVAELTSKLKAPNGLTSENLGQVDEVASDLQLIAQDKTKLEAAQRDKVSRASIKVGIASYYEKLAVDATKNTVTGGFGALRNIGSVGDTIVVAKAAPTNLKSMLGVQTALFSYMSAHGSDPSANVQREVAALEKQ
jgi:hypothetical protein